MKTTAGPAHIGVQEIDADLDPLTVFRLVRSTSDPAASFRSNYELGRNARGIETSWAIIHVGISVYLDESVAGATAMRWPKLGRYVAEVRLRAGHGFNVARTGQPLHLTIWGDPVKLSDAITDIRPV
jgi:hypothetical protein